MSNKYQAVMKYLLKIMSYHVLAIYNKFLSFKLQNDYFLDQFKNKPRVTSNF